jgi:hypothetical protein
VKNIGINFRPQNMGARTFNTKAESMDLICALSIHDKPAVTKADKPKPRPTEMPIDLLPGPQ